MPLAAPIIAVRPRSPSVGGPSAGAGGGANTAAYGAVAGLAAVAYAASNTPPAASAAYAVAAQSATVAYAATNVPPGRTAAYAATAQAASTAYSATNTPPAIAAALGASAQAATVAYAVANVPPAGSVGYAATAQPATAAYAVTNVPPAGSATYAATAQPAVALYAASNVPPARTAAYAATALAATASYSAANTPPAGSTAYGAAAQPATATYTASSVPPSRTAGYAVAAQSATVAYAVAIPASTAAYTPAALAATAIYSGAAASGADPAAYAASARPATATYAANTGGASMVQGYISGSGTSIELRTGSAIISLDPGTEVQRVAASGIAPPSPSPLSSTFRLAFGGQTTGTIACTASHPAACGLWQVPTISGHHYRFSGCYPASQYLNSACLAEVIQADGTIAATKSFSQTLPAMDVTSNGFTWLDYAANLAATGTTASVRITALSLAGTPVAIDGLRVEDLTAGGVVYYDGLTHCTIFGAVDNVNIYGTCFTSPIQKLKYGGVGLGGPVAINASDLQAKLVALSSIGAGNLTAAANSDGSANITYTGALAFASQPLPTSPTTSPVMAIAEVTPGGNLPTFSVDGGSAVTIQGPWIVPTSLAATLVFPIPQATPMVIAPSSVATLHIPAGFLVLASGAVPAGTISLVNRSGGSTLAAFDSATPRTMGVGYGITPASAATTHQIHSNFATRVDVFVPGANNVAAINADGYPTRAASSSAISVQVVVEDSQYPGDGQYARNAPTGVWRLIWSGASTHTLSGSVTPSGSPIISGGDTEQRYTVATNGSEYGPLIHLQINPTGPDGSGAYIVDSSNVRLYPPDPADASGNTPWTSAIPKFYPPYVEQHRGSRSFRYLDVTQAIYNSWTDASDFPTDNSLARSYIARTVKASIVRVEGYTGAANDTTNAIQVLVTTSAAHTFKLGWVVFFGNCGTIQLSGEQKDFPGPTAYPLGPGGFDHGWVAAIPDSTHLIVTIGEAATTAVVTNVLTPSGVPLTCNVGPAWPMRDYFELANAVDDLMPGTMEFVHLNASTTISPACAAAWATLAAAILKPTIKLKCELGNETWNTGYPFFSYRWLRTRGFQLAGVDNYRYAHAKLKPIMDAPFQAAFTAAGRPNDYIYVWGVKADGGEEAGLLFGQIAAASPGARVGELCGAPYLIGSLVADPAQQAAMTDGQACDLLEALYFARDWSYLAGNVAAAAAAGYSGVRYVGYEGGFGPGSVYQTGDGVYQAIQSAPVALLFDKVRWSPRLYRLTLAYLDGLQTQAGMTHLCDYYHMRGGQLYGKFGYLGQLRGTGDPAQDPANVSSPRMLTTGGVKSEVGGAYYLWNSLVGATTPTPAATPTVLFANIAALRAGQVR